MAGKNVEIKIGAKDMASRVLRSVSGSVSSLASKAGVASASIAKTTAKIGLSFRSLGKKLALGFAVAVPAAFGFAVRAFANFDDKMAAVAAKTGAVGSELDAMRQKAKELGSSTKFSASEAAEGMEMLAQAGFSTNQILAGIGPTLSLAAAGGVGLKEAADIASDIGGAFRIPADELGRVADVLAATATSANTDILKMGETMSIVAPIAEMTGQSLEEVAAAAGILGNSGVKASVAGTDLKNILSKFSTKSVQQDLSKMGVSVLSATGEMRPMMDVLTDMGQKMQNMTGPEKAAKMIEVFGERSAKSAAIISGTVSTAIDEMRKNTTDSTGAADRMAETMAGALGGAGVKIMSAFEGVQIALIDVIKKPLMKAAADIAGFLSNTTKLIERYKGLIRGIAVSVRVAWDVTSSIVRSAAEAIKVSITGVGDSAVSMKSVIESVLVGIVTGLTFVEVAVTNLPAIWAIAADTVSLTVLGLVNDIIHAFTVTLPDKLLQMKAVVQNIFVDMAIAISRIYKDVIDGIAAQFDRLAQYDPTGILAKGLEGNKSASNFIGDAIQRLEGIKLPIPEGTKDRVQTQEERAIQARIGANAQKLGAEFTKKLVPRLAELKNAFAEEITEAGEEDGKKKDGKGLLGGDGPGSLLNAIKSAAPVLQATQSRLLTRGTASDPMLDEAKVQTKLLERTAKAVEILHDETDANKGETFTFVGVM